MKRPLCLVVFIAISLTILSGCGDSTQSDKTTNWKPTTYEIVNNFDGVTMDVKEGTVSPTGLTVVFKNNSDSEGLYGNNFSLEKKIDEKWHQVPTIISDYGFDGEGYSLPSKEDSEWNTSWEWLYGSLDMGQYRIIKDILDFRGTGDYDKYYLAAEFTIY